MLVLCKNLSAAMTRPKYYRLREHPMWVVWDSDLHKRVFGPASARACQNFMDQVALAEETMKEILEEERHAEI